MKRGIFILISILICYGCSAIPRINLSGVWSPFGASRLTHIRHFSWGDNPVYVQYTAIDLGAQPPIAYTEYGSFHITAVEQGNEYYILSGKWADGTIGEIKIGVIDENTIWFESMSPYEGGVFGRDYYYCRVPKNAKINPIDPEEGP